MYKDVWSLMRKKLNPVILQNKSPRAAADRCALHSYCFFRSGGCCQEEQESGLWPPLVPLGTGCPAGCEHGGKAEGPPAQDRARVPATAGQAPKVDVALGRGQPAAF